MKIMIQIHKPVFNSIIKHDNHGNAHYDLGGNLTANHPAIRAQIEADSKKFREITDLHARGLI